VYLTGFNNHHQSESVKGALPTDQNSPQHCHNGLVAEQLSGSAFTRPRHHNLHSWLYRREPSVVHTDFTPYPHTLMTPLVTMLAPNPMRWSAFDPPLTHHDFIDGLIHLASNELLNTYLYQCTQSMEHRYFNNHDGELLLVPYSGKIQLCTEFGILTIQPGMIAVVPRGVFFKVRVLEAFAAGYLCENKTTPFTLPELGLIGANGLANPRHFLYPRAATEDTIREVQLLCKHQDHLWIASSPSSPLNVVAWHGNYAPYCYDLALFNTINTVSFDHPDPSIFTVLTSVSDTLGVANIDFVIFPPRWMVANHTFRPPYFHRNIMSEFMGLITGEYDAKSSGFDVGGFSVHNRMVAHGPDTDVYRKASQKPLKPTYYDNTLAFMFESREPFVMTEKIMSHASRQNNYTQCWQT
jgi:homogentisate 1,2-dioxygenase